jgi:hypothetical protein
MSTRSQIFIAVGVVAAVLLLVTVTLTTQFIAAVNRSGSATAPTRQGAQGLGEPAPWTPPAEPTRAQPTTIVVKLGETLILTRSGLGAADEYHFTLTADKQYTRSTKYGMRPEKGVYFAVKALIEVKTGSTYACACDFALVATDGAVYEPNSGFGFTGALDAVTLNAGQRASGLVVFDLPPAALAGARIELREGLFSSGNEGYWQL